MTIANTKWLAKLAENEQRPVYVVQFDGLGYAFSSSSNVPGAGPWSAADSLGGVGEMEDPLVDWTATTSGSAAITKDLTEQRSGTACAKFVRSGSNDCYLTKSDITGLQGSKWYTISFALKGDLNGEALFFRIQNLTTLNYLTDAGTWSASAGNVWGTSPTAAWSTYHRTFQMEAGADPSDLIEMRIYNLGTPGAGSHTHYVDDVYWYGPSDTEFAKPYMNTPTGAHVKVDPIDGKQTIGALKFSMVDVNDEVTNLISTDAPGAALSTMINRKTTLYSGWRDLALSDYIPRFVGHIAGDIILQKDLVTYDFEAQSVARLLDGKIMTLATEVAPITVTGNVVNLLYALMTDDFSTGGDFPLDSFTAGVNGIGIPVTSINTAQMIEQRDTWHSASNVEVVFEEEEDGRQFMEDEIFRVFQCFPAISGQGLLGLKFHVPALPAAEAPTLTADDIIGIGGWRRLQSDHLNKFKVMGDFSTGSDDYETAMYDTETADDTADQGSTGEVIEYFAESRLLTTGNSGDIIAQEMTGRHRIRYLKGPAQLPLKVHLSRQDLQQGDVIAITDDRIPDLRTGTRGISSRLMQILSVKTNWAKGDMDLVLLDTGYKRYGVIAPNGTADYTAATEQERNTFFYIGDTNGNVSSSGGVGTVEGYRFI